MEGWSILRRLSGGWGVWLWFLGIRKRGGERSSQERSPQPSPGVPGEGESAGEMLWLHEARFAGDGDGRRRQRTPFEFVGHGVFLGVERLVPGDRLAGVGGHSAHDRKESRFGHALAVVDHFALA